MCGFCVDGRWKTAINFMNPDGTKGELAKAFAAILHEMWNVDVPWIAPIEFRVTRVSWSRQIQS